MPKERAGHLSFRIAPDMLEEARDLAAHLGITVTELVRDAVAACIEAERKAADGLRTPVGTWQIAGCPVRFFREPTGTTPALPWADIRAMLEATKAAPADIDAALDEALRSQPERIRRINTAKGSTVVASPFWAVAVIDSLVLSGLAPPAAADDLAAAVVASSRVLVDGRALPEAEAFMLAAVAGAIGDVAGLRHVEAAA